MASYVKDKLTGGSSDDSGDKDKYHVSVSASTTYDEDASKQIVINGPPCDVSDNCKVAVRIKEYQGIPVDSPPTSSYFEDSAHSKDTYSVAVSWIPTEDISAEDLVWGIELKNPIRDRIPKRFINTAFSIVKEFIDPSLRCDPYADKPWLNGPILCSSAITFSIGSSSLEVPPILSEGSISDDSSIRSEHNIPPSEDKRRKYFSDAKNRESFTFEKGRCYAFDFHNGYIDWRNYALKLPGFSLGVLKYIDERTHTLRFVMKSRKSGELFVATTFRLLFGEELEKAIKKDEEKKKKENANTGGNVGAAVQGKRHENKQHSESKNSHIGLADQGDTKHGKRTQQKEPKTRSSERNDSSSPGEIDGVEDKTEVNTEQTHPPTNLPRTPSSKPFHQNLSAEMNGLNFIDTNKEHVATNTDGSSTSSNSHDDATEPKTDGHTTASNTDGDTGSEIGGATSGRNTGLDIDWNGKGDTDTTGVTNTETSAPGRSIEESLMATATRDLRK